MHAVVPPGRVRDSDDQRAVPQVQPRDAVQRIEVWANHPSKSARRVLAGGAELVHRAALLEPGDVHEDQRVEVRVCIGRQRLHVPRHLCSQPAGASGSAEECGVVSGAKVTLCDFTAAEP